MWSRQPSRRICYSPVVFGLGPGDMSGFALGWSRNAGGSCLLFDGLNFVLQVLYQCPMTIDFPLKSKRERIAPQKCEKISGAGQLTSFQWKLQQKLTSSMDFSYLNWLKCSWHSAAQEVEAHSLPHPALATLLVKTSLHLAIEAQLKKWKKKNNIFWQILLDLDIQNAKYSLSTNLCLQCAHGVARLCHWDSPMEVQSPPQSRLQKSLQMFLPFFTFPKPLEVMTLGV